ncbi:ribbon-helix-helix domain-containing protein [Pseudoduganella sp. LjRoot289]|uniref:ribbon-helix-helix domain-containing protein n=1 Tax=Pseudoduganella sp. LjRoot289 TaxID=3342314 RepID=UPI003ECCEAF6
MTRLTIEVDDQLAAVVAELGRAENRAVAEIVRSAITEYVRQASHGSMPISVKVGQASVSVSVRDRGAHPTVPLEERKRLLERTAGMWAGKGIDGLDYQRRLRAEW